MQTPPQSRVPPGHWHEPPVQLPKGQAPHPAPAVPVPHIGVVSFATVTQLLPLQQPVQDVASHLTARAPFKQIWFVPQADSAVPSWTLLVNVHIGPELHDITPFWHGLLPGLQAALAVHAVHVPALQTPVSVPLVQDVPFIAATFVSMHVATPAVQTDTVPTWHGLVEGAQAAPTLQAAHRPALQYMVVSHVIPSVALRENVHTGAPVAQA